MSDSFLDHPQESVLIIEPGRTEKNYWPDLWHYRKTLPLEKQIEVLDLIAFFKTRQLPVEIASEPITPKTAEEVESFFRSFQVGTSGYIFNRDDANAS